MSSDSTDLAATRAKSEAERALRPNTVEETAGGCSAARVALVLRRPFTGAILRQKAKGNAKGKERVITGIQPHLQIDGEGLYKVLAGIFCSVRGKRLPNHLLPLRMEERASTWNEK